MPTPEQIKAARAAAGLSVLEAAALIGYSYRTWEGWEYGRRPMRQAVFDAFVAKTKKRKGKTK